MFLCKFLCRLVTSYNSLCEEAGVEFEGPIENDLYKTALTNTLRTHCREDATEHGRLLALKKTLAGLTHEKQLDEEQIACLYIKDISRMEDRELDDEETIEELLQNLPDEEKINQVVHYRSEVAVLPDDDMFR